MKEVTTIENQIGVRSGHVDTELKMLRVARLLGDDDPQLDVRTTFLGAHALPPEYASDRRDAYVRLVADKMLSLVYLQNLADAVDGFCETIAFSPEEIEQVFDRAKRTGICDVKLHADQLSDLNGAALAARYQALSGRSSRGIHPKPASTRSPAPAPLRSCCPAHFIF